MTNPEAIATLVDRLSRIAHSLQYSQGLNPAQWEALRYLARANKYSTSPGVLAEYLGTTKGTVSQTLIALESKGLIQRVRCDADRRKVRLGLTEAGCAMLRNDPLHRIENACRDLPLTERERMLPPLTAIVEGLCRRQEAGGFGVCGKCCHLASPDGVGTCEGSRRCGLTNEPLAPDELTQICVSFEPAK
jgi:DNA-binding MarR family transcriptional regulator